MPIVTTDGLTDTSSAVTPGVQPNWAVATGTVDAILAAYTPVNTALIDGLLLGVRASGANTSTTPTFTPDDLPPHVIVKRGSVALAAGDIPGAGAELLLRFNLAAGKWVLLNPIVP